MVGVLKIAAIVLFVIGAFIGLGGLSKSKTFSAVVGLLFAVTGAAALFLSVIPNSFASNIETKAVEFKYRDWEKSATMVVSKEGSSYTTHHNNRTRKKYTYYIRYTNGEIIKDPDNYKGSYLHVYVNGKKVAVKDAPNNEVSSIESTNSNIYHSLYEGQMIIVAKKKQTIGYKVEFILPEYTPEKWKKEYGIE